MSHPHVGKYYYHFKHNDSEGVDHMAYQVIGVGYHTETEEMLVAYKPLYKDQELFDKKLDMRFRPLSMWFEEVERDGYKGPRFILIESKEIIQTLSKSL